MYAIAITRSIMPSPGLQYGKVVRFTLYAPDIFRIHPKPGSHCKQGMDLKHNAYNIINDMVIPFQFPSFRINQQGGWKHQARTKALLVPPIPNPHFFSRELVEAVERCKASICCNWQHVKFWKTSRRCHVQHLRHYKTSKGCNSQRLKGSKSSKYCNCCDLQLLKRFKTGTCVNYSM